MTRIRYGGFWRRLVAYFIDILLIYAASGTIFWIMCRVLDSEMVFHHHGYGYGHSSGWISHQAIAYYLLVTLLNMFYFTYFHGITGQTPGKMALGLRVVRTSGNDMTWGIAFLRWIGYVVSKLAVYLGFIWIAFHPRKRGWHDMIAGTCVVRAGYDYEEREPVTPSPDNTASYPHTDETIPL